MKHPDKTPSIRDLLSILFKHQRKILWLFGAFFTAGILSAFLMPPLYEAKSSLLVKFGREYLNRPEVGDSQAILSLDQQELINSEIEILKNRDGIERVVSTLTVENLYPDLAKNPDSKIPPKDAAILRFEKKLNAEGVRKSNVIEVSFRHGDPEIAARAVNLLVEFFKEKHLQVMSNPQSSFLKKQLEDYENNLKESAFTLETYNVQNRLFSLEEQRNLLLRQRTDLDTSLKTAQNTIRELQEKVASLNRKKKSLAGKPPMYTPTERDRIVVETKSRLLNLKIQEQELLRKYREENPLVQNVRKDIQMVTEFLAEQENEIRGKVETGNRVFQEIELELFKAEADLNSQTAKEGILAQQLKKLDGEILTLSLTERQQQKLRREHAKNERYYQAYVDKLEQARISDELNQMKLANISVIQGASVPKKPVRPRKTINILLGFFLGVFSGITAAILSEYYAQCFSTPESVERRLGLPVLTSIPLRQ